MPHPFTVRPVAHHISPQDRLAPADRLLRDHALREEGARSVLAALKLLLKSCVTITADGRRVIPAEIVEALLSGNANFSQSK